MTSSDPFPTSGPDVRVRFAPTAKAYRRVCFISRASIILVFLFVLIGVRLSESVQTIFLIAYAVFSVVLIILAPRLKCPACQLPLAGRMGNGVISVFCPECGSSDIKPSHGSFLRLYYFPGQCRSCNKKFWRAMGNPYYKIHFCTHCNAHVDDEGV
jgi:ribosomal protein L37AE/L43A